MGLHNFDKKIDLCSIINIKSGDCANDCMFCAQSRHYGSNKITYPLLSREELLKRIMALDRPEISHIGLVASGATLCKADLDRICDVISAVPDHIKKKICLSGGILGDEELRQIWQAGIRHYHHNLETSPRFYPRICSTQPWQARKATVGRALALGFEVCSGFLFGMGESQEDRRLLALELKSLNIKNIPMNFLDPVPGTPLGQRQPMSCDEALETITMFRDILPDAILRVCGGRLKTFGDRIGEVFEAGAKALMTGDFLTTRGQTLEDDLKLIHSQGLIA